MYNALRAAHVGRILLLLAGLLMWVTAAQTAEGFAVLGHYDKANARRWTNNIEPFIENGLTYSFESGDAFWNAERKRAVTNALSTWSNAGTGICSIPAPYEAVAADDNLLATLPKNFFGMPLQWEGPDWLGANIDFFSRPDDFYYDIWGVRRTMSGKLGFAEIITAGGEILSVDIYFNQIHNPDFESLALHEIGHALGLDHPEQAPSGRNYNPLTYEPEPYTAGWEGTIMCGSYHGIRRELQQEDTGGLQFLYGDLDVPPYKSGAIIRNFTAVNGTVNEDEIQEVNDTGSFNLSDPNSPHYELGMALQEDGLEGIDDPFTQYLLLEQQDIPVINRFTSPDATSGRIEFDFALVSGPIVDRDAYLRLFAGDTEVFYVDFGDLPEDMEFTAFEPTEGCQLRTEYMHITIYFEDIPPEFFDYWFDVTFEVGTYGSSVGDMPSYGIPEPASLTAMIISIIAVACVARFSCSIPK